MIPNKILTNTDFANYSRDGYYATQKPGPGSNPPADDAWLKHSAVVEIVEFLKIQYSNIVDPGCHVGKHMSSQLFLAQRTGAALIAIDLQQIAPWQRDYAYSTCIIGDYFRVSKTAIDAASIDLIIDTCAVTHFAPSHIHAANDGCYHFGNDAMRILKPGGYFICVSDIDETCERGEYVTPENMVESFSAGGLQLVGDSNFCYDDAFQGALKVARLVFQKPLEGHS